MMLTDLLLEFLRQLINTKFILFIGLLNTAINIACSTLDFANTTHSTLAPIKDEVVFVQVLYRHGDRTPIAPYKTDPWNNLKYWPTAWGQLTNVGKDEHYKLGKWLRKRYHNLLSETYNRDEIFVISTDVDRTIMSALANLAGLYEPLGKDVWNKFVHWQPIPVHVLPEYLDNILAAKVHCPVYEHALTVLQNSPEFRKLNQRYKYLSDYLTKHTGEMVYTLESIQRINNTLFIEDLYNKTLPQWTKNVYPSNEMTYVSGFTFSISTYTRQMARLKVGPLIKDILQRFLNKTNRLLKPDRKMWIYSAHDTTLASLLNTLKLFEVHSPPYAACILIEMRLDSQQIPYITILYKNSSTEPAVLHIPECGIFCPLNRMIKLYEDIIPDDWNNECNLNTVMISYKNVKISGAIGVVAAIISSILFLTYAVIVVHRRRGYTTYVSYALIKRAFSEWFFQIRTSKTNWLYKSSMPV